MGGISGISHISNAIAQMSVSERGPVASPPAGTTASDVVIAPKPVKKAPLSPIMTRSESTGALLSQDGTQGRLVALVKGLWGSNVPTDIQEKLVDPAVSTPEVVQTVQKHFSGDAGSIVWLLLHVAKNEGAEVAKENAPTVFNALYGSEAFIQWFGATNVKASLETLLDAAAQTDADINALYRGSGAAINGLNELYGGKIGSYEPFHLSYGAGSAERKQFQDKVSVGGEGDARLNAEAVVDRQLDRIRGYVIKNWGIEAFAKYMPLESELEAKITQTREDISLDASAKGAAYEAALQNYWTKFDRLRDLHAFRSPETTYDLHAKPFASRFDHNRAVAMNLRHEMRRLDSVDAEDADVGAFYAEAAKAAKLDKRTSYYTDGGGNLSVAQLQQLRSAMLELNAKKIIEANKPWASGKINYAFGVNGESTYNSGSASLTLRLSDGGRWKGAFGIKASNAVNVPKFDRDAVLPFAGPDMPSDAISISGGFTATWAKLITIAVGAQEVPGGVAGLGAGVSAGHPFKFGGGAHSISLSSALGFAWSLQQPGDWSAPWRKAAPTSDDANPGFDIGDPVVGWTLGLGGSFWKKALTVGVNYSMNMTFPSEGDGALGQGLKLSLGSQPVSGVKLGAHYKTKFFEGEGSFDNVGASASWNFTEFWKMAVGAKMTYTTIEGAPFTRTDALEGDYTDVVVNDGLMAGGTFAFAPFEGPVNFEVFLAYLNNSIGESEREATGSPRFQAQFSAKANF